MVPENQYRVHFLGFYLVRVNKKLTHARIELFSQSGEPQLTAWPLVIEIHLISSLHSIYFSNKLLFESQLQNIPILFY